MEPTDTGQGYLPVPRTVTRGRFGWGVERDFRSSTREGSAEVRIPSVITGGDYYGVIGTTKQLSDGYGTVYSRNGFKRTEGVTVHSPRPP